jgi:hypothetical protein
VKFGTARTAPAMTFGVDAFNLLNRVNYSSCVAARWARRCSASRSRRERRDNCSFRDGSSSKFQGGTDATLATSGDTVRTRCLVAGLAAAVAIVGAGQPAAAQDDQPTIDLVVAGTSAARRARSSASS